MVNDNGTPQRLETAREIAQFLNVSTAVIRKWTCTTDIPRIRCGRAVRYDRAEVLAWLKSKQSRDGEGR